MARCPGQQACWPLLLLAAVGLLAALPAAGQTGNATFPGPDPGLVRVVNGRFVGEDCQEYQFTGWNAWRLLELGANQASAPGFSSGQDYVRKMFASAASLGLRVVRFFATADNGGVTLMTSPTTFNEGLAKGLDFVLDEAGKAGIKATVVLLNLWKFDGVPFFEKQCGTNTINRTPNPALDPRPDIVPLNSTERLQDPFDWYLREDCRQQVKDYYTTVVNRVNTINRRTYKEDPTIFSWNLINEPRCKYCGPEAIDQWVADLAQHMKQVDPNHLLTVGEEGFFDAHDPRAIADPDVGDQVTLQTGLPNHAYTGQDFSPNHASKYIDYAAFHLWPDNWGNQSLDFGRTWIEAHIAAAEALGKALVLEEFGKGSPEGTITAVRDPWYDLVYGAVDSSLAAGRPLRAALFWQWDFTGQVGRGFSSLVRSSDSTFTNIVQPFAHKMAAGAHKSAGSLVPGCTPVRGGAPGSSTSSGSSTSGQPTQLFQQQGQGGGGLPSGTASTAGTAGRKLLAG